MIERPSRFNQLLSEFLAGDPTPESEIAGRQRVIGALGGARRPASRTWPARRRCRPAAGSRRRRRARRSPRRRARRPCGGSATSIVIVSPSRTAAIGPPHAASGATWPAMKPRVAPEKRPSVSSATCSPSPSPDERRRDREHLAHAGAAGGPSLRITTTSPASIAPAVTAAIASSSHSKTRAGPSWWTRSWPASFTTRALGREVAAQDRQAAGLLHRVVERADDLLARRSPRAARASSPIVRPVTVCASSCRMPASSRRLATTPTPPAS